MKLLLTAFDPFGGEAVNPALEAIKLIPEQLISKQVISCLSPKRPLSHQLISEQLPLRDDQTVIEMTKLTVPTVFHKSIATVWEAVKIEKPAAVLCIGQAGGRFELTPERVAINIDDARIPDNEGNQPIDLPVFEDGAPAYFSTLPIKAMVSAIRQAGLPASLSNTAGTFVCNHLMYGLLYHLQKEHPEIRAGFMHVPFVPAQVVDRQTPAPSMNVQDIAIGIEAALIAIATHQEDLHTAEGRTH